MAKRVVVELVDDLTGKPGATTVRFGLDGVDYEIDLADETQLRAMLALIVLGVCGKIVFDLAVTPDNLFVMDSAVILR